MTPCSDTNAISLDEYLETSKTLVNARLDMHLNSDNIVAPQLLEACRYAVLSGGKRIRPLLCFAAARVFGADAETVADAAAAIEMIHAYSLVHDDLPAMDDDDLRRGQPTVHKAFNDATAILVGDALQPLAFEILTSSPKATPELALACVMELSYASGGAGMVAGQIIDCDATGQQLTIEQLEQMHQLKTGALIRASLLIGAYLSGQASIEDAAQLAQYGQAIGLAFQVQDDILDACSDTATLGKTAGADAILNKPTYVSLLGLEGAKAKLAELHQQALESLSTFDDNADMLRQLANYIVERKH